MSCIQSNVLHVQNIATLRSLKVLAAAQCCDSARQKSWFSAKLRCVDRYRPDLSVDTLTPELSVLQKLQSEQAWSRRHFELNLGQFFYTLS